MRDPAGAVAGRIFAFRDISSEHAVERMKSDFVSTVSVELRAPLTTIYGFAQTLLREDITFSDAERRTFTEFISNEAKRLTTIVDALLDVARLDTGEPSVSLVPTDVASVVADVVAAVRTSANGHRLVAEVGPEPLSAQADPDKLRQVLDQLVSNAVKYSPRGGVVSVSAQRRHDAVEVSVADEGIGIPVSERERIFAKFYKASGGQGTGLGLFIAQGLVREMGSTISRRLGGGARIDVRLRVAGRAGRRGVSFADGGITNPMATRVLVIDDESPIRLLCRINLEAEGMEVLEAANGPSGLDTARAARPDVILLDVMMPGLDGWHVAEELLDDDRTEEIPIVFLTARAELRDRARGIDLGGVDYVTKPFNPVELAPLVRELLARVERGERDDLRREKLSELRLLLERGRLLNAPSGRAGSPRGRPLRRRVGRCRGSRRATPNRRGRRRRARASRRSRPTSRSDGGAR